MLDNLGHKEAFNKIQNPKTDRQGEKMPQFVDWAEKVKTDVISKAISNIV